ncbi:MAG: hypothetical protein FWH40_06600 [Coriobacteriia bacterium]|nr:hypothetical protein [Coriobacteriia bacterium]
MNDSAQTPLTIYVDESLVDIASNMYAVHNELEDARMKFKQSISIINEHYVNTDAQTRFNSLFDLFDERLAVLSSLYKALSDYCFYVLSIMTETDAELAAKVLLRAESSFAATEEPPDD